MYLINRQIEKVAVRNSRWIQSAVPKKNRGKFEQWCRANGFSGVNQAAINKAIAQGGHPAKMANFAINVSKGKYSHPS